jgi:hypothetical protein
MSTPSLARLRSVLNGIFSLARWDDIRPNGVSVGADVANLTRKAIKSGGFLYDHFVRNQTDVLYYSFQTKHGWPRTPVRPHVHVIPTSLVAGAPSTVLGNAYFRFRWYWTGLGTDLAVPDTPTEQFIALPITIADQMQELAVGPLITPPAEATMSSHLHVEMSRLGADPLDTYDSDAFNGVVAANLAFISADCHAQLKQTGSLFEFSDLP